MAAIARQGAAALVLIALGGLLGTGSTHAASAPADGRLIVSQKLESCCYIEGTKSFVRVSGPESAGGHSRAPAHVHELLLDTGLPPGSYRVHAYQRPCDGNCGYLDQPTDACSKRVRLVAGGQTHVRVHASPGESCRMVVRAKPPG